MPSSSASTIAGSDPPSRNGVTYLVAVTVLKLIVYQVLYSNEPFRYKNFRKASYLPLPTQ
jgi:hypothetical protein